MNRIASIYMFSREGFSPKSALPAFVSVKENARRVGQRFQIVPSSAPIAGAKLAGSALRVRASRVCSTGIVRNAENHSSTIKS